MITIKDIARESGYSVGTVSRVLNGHKNVSDKARTQIMAVVDKYNFQLNGNAKLLKQRYKMECNREYAQRLQDTCDEIVAKTRVLKADSRNRSTETQR
jgi:transcriptional regulator with XRE-family HTH domain